MTAKVIPLHRIARAMNDARAIGTPEDEWRRLRNEVQFYRSDRLRIAEEGKNQFDRGYRKGFWAGSVFWTVCGMWISVLFALLWSVA